MTILRTIKVTGASLLMLGILVRTQSMRLTYPVKDPGMNCTALIAQSYPVGFRLCLCVEWAVIAQSWSPQRSANVYGREFELHVLLRLMRKDSSGSNVLTATGIYDS